MRLLSPMSMEAVPPTTPGVQTPALVVCRAGRVEARMPAVPKASQPLPPPRRLLNSLRMARAVSARVKVGAVEVAGVGKTCALLVEMHVSSNIIIARLRNDENMFKSSIWQ